jgi:energy-coupling factor transport system permease protein
VSAAFDVYVPGHTWLHRADARVKFVFAMLFAGLMLLWISLPLLVLMLALTHVAIRILGFRWRQIGSIWVALAPFMLLIAALWPLFDRTGAAVLIEWGIVRITGEGVLTGIGTGLRVAAISFVFLVWLGSTDQRAMVRAFVRLGLPYRVGMALTIGLRFISTFAGVFATVSDAQQSRGLVLAGRGFKRLRKLLPILVAALVTSLRMSEQLAWTLEARGFGARRERTTLRDLRMTRLDWILLVGILVVAAGLYGLTLATGLGRDVLWPHTYGS